MALQSHGNRLVSSVHAICSSNMDFSYRSHVKNKYSMCDERAMKELKDGDRKMDRELTNTRGYCAAPYDVAHHHVANVMMRSLVIMIVDVYWIFVALARTVCDWLILLTTHRLVRNRGDRQLLVVLYTT